jgi:hypothetical protein
MLAKPAQKLLLYAKKTSENQAIFEIDKTNQKQ